MRTTKWLSVLLITGVIVAGCGDKDKNPTGPEEDQLVVPQVVTVKGPTSQNTPPAVSASAGMLNTMGSLGQAFLGSIQASNAKKSGDSYVWTYNNGEALVTVISTPSDNGVNWQVKVTGSYDNVQVKDFVILKGFSTADGKSGWWEMYDPTTGEKQMRYEWTTDSNNTVHATFMVYGDTPMKYEIVNNQDGSGTLAMYEGNVKTLEASWEANGSGTYTVWDEDGNVVDQGSWT